ncbi:MAG: hypothetical protein AB1567_04415 [bacterium]
MAISTELYDFVVKVVEEKTEGIKLLRQDFSDLKAVVFDLGQAQKMTEVRVEELAQAQKKTEGSLTKLELAVEKLAQAQTNTEKKVGDLATAVGSLSDTIGFGIEDIARVVIPSYLFRHMGIDVKGELERRFFKVDSKEVEINLYGEGITKQGDKIKIFGECKSKIKKAQINQFVKCLKNLGDVKGEILKVMCGFYIHPSATDIARKENILLIASYQR